MLRTLLGCIREYKKVSILTPIFITVEVIMETLMVFVIKDLINLMESGNVNEIWKYGLILISLALVSLFCGIANGITGAKASAGFASNVRHDAFHKIQDFSFENIDSFQTSSLVTRLTTDVNNIQMAYQMILRIAIRCPLMIIFSIIMAFSINSELAWVFVIAMPILGFALFAIARHVMPVFRKLFKKYDKLNNSIQENVKGVRVVKSTSNSLSFETTFTSSIIPCSTNNSKIIAFKSFGYSFKASKYFNSVKYIRIFLFCN